MRRVFMFTSFLILAVSSFNPSSASQVEVKPLEHQKIFDELKTALKYFDELPGLADKKWFGRDQKSANEDLDSTIDEIIELLDAPDINKHRRNYRKIEQYIIDEKQEIAILTEKLLFAPKEDLTLVTKFTPTQTLKNVTATTRGDYELLIQRRQSNVLGYQESLSAILLEMQNLLLAMGIDIPADQIEVWLSSVVGDDVISMSVIFNSIKQVAKQLEMATEKHNENLTHARQYYGMVVILHRLIMKMQNEFISKIDSEYLPKLASFKSDANNVIAESKRLLNSGGNKEALKSNIKANELTIKAINLYSAIIQDQRVKVHKALQLSQREYKVANNTYKTVNLSSQVAQLIKQGTTTFQTLSNLQVPDAKPFQNNEMKEEFRKLSERMGK